MALGHAHFSLTGDHVQIDQRKCVSKAAIAMDRALPYSKSRLYTCFGHGIAINIPNMRHRSWMPLQIVMVMAGALMVLPAQQAPQAGNNTTQPDNTRTNRADRAAGGPTAEQAKNDRSDREVMQKIRKDIVSDKSLSTYAHNVKVIADHGKVTLKGPVHTDDERKTIEAKAAAVVGAENVTDDITVKNNNSPSRSRQ